MGARSRSPVVQVHLLRSCLPPCEVRLQPRLHLRLRCGPCLHLWLRRPPCHHLWLRRCPCLHLQILRDPRLHRIHRIRRIAIWANVRPRLSPSPCTATPLTPDTLDILDTLDTTDSPSDPSTTELDTPTFTTTGVKPNRRVDKDDHGITNQNSDIAIKL